MKKLLSILMATLMLIGTFAVLPVSAGNTDTLDDHLITHWDFAGDNVLADKAPNGNPDTLIEGNPYRIAYGDGLATLKIGGPGVFYAEKSDDFLRTPALESTDDADRYDRTIFIRFKISEFKDTDEFAYIMNQNGAFNMYYRLNGNTKDLRTYTALKADHNKAQATEYDVSEFVTVAIVYDKNYDAENGASMTASLYSGLENSDTTAIVSTDTKAYDLLTYECTASADGSTTCSCGKTGTAYNGACVDRFYIGGSPCHKNMGDNRNMVIDDIRIYDKALTGDELLLVKKSITNPLPTPGVVPPPVEDDSDTEQFTNVGHSLTLKGNTDINFYFKPVDGAEISANAKVALTNASGKQVDNKMLSDISKTDGTYKYSFGVAAKQMNETFTLTVTDGDNTVYTNTYSIREYAKYIIDNASKYEAKLVDLVTAMLNYGAYSQLSFNYDTENLANKDLNLGAPAAFTAKEGLGAKTNGAINGITYSAATLVLNDATHVVFKFIVDGISNNDITVEGAKDYKIMAGILQVESEGLVASALDDEVSVMVKVGNESITVSYSPLAYIMNMADSTDANTQNLVRAMYAYHVAAEAYVA